MSKEKINQIKVGFMIFVFLLLLGILSFFLEKIKVKEEGYVIKVRFNYIGELKVGAPVYFAGGVKVGKVIKITPEGNKIIVHLKLKKDFKIKRGNEIYIYTHGLLGEKYVEITGYEGPGEYLKNGDIVDGIDPVSLDAMTVQLARIFKGVFQPTLTDEEVKQSFANLFNNAGALAYNLNMLVNETRPPLQSTLLNIKVVTAELESNLRLILNELRILSQNASSLSSKENIKRINTLISDLEKASRELKVASKELTKASKNLANITYAIKAQKGTAGKLIYNKKIYYNLLKTSENLRKLSEKVLKNPKILLFK